MARQPECIDRLTAAGISYGDAVKLRRIAATLHRWHEHECGTDSACIVRGRKKNGAFEYDDNGPPFLEHAGRMGPNRYEPIPDQERDALHKLADIMSRYPSLSHYIQGDPRGAPLYILRPGDIPDGKSADSYYNNGIAVYR